MGSNKKNGIAEIGVGMKTSCLLFIIHSALLIFNCFSQQPGWEIIPSGTNTPLNSIFFYDYEVGYACGDSGIVIKSIDSGKTWQTIPTPVTYNFNDLFVFNDSTLCLVGDFGTILFSFDGGVNWYGSSSFLTSEDYLSISYSGTKGVCGGRSQTILYGIYEGTSITWIVYQTGFFGGGFWGAHMLNPQIGFVAGENSIFGPLLGMTTDSGVNWDFTAFYLNNNEGRATGVDFTDIINGYVSARVWDGRGAISKTIDGGSDWVTTFFTNPLWSIDFPISGASQTGYSVGSEGTILKTYNAGNNWQAQQSGTILKLNKVQFLDLDFGFAVGENGIILKTTTGGEPVTDISQETGVVKEFRLEQNFPNPFNPSTNIRFTIADFRFTSLKVFDILGEEVATLVNENLPAGEYEVEFNPVSSIRHKASGVFFYQLIAGNNISSKKMLLIK